MALLEVQGLHARYGEIEAIHGIDLEIERGAFVALLGANGAGKTSTLRAITGGIKRSGRVSFDGKLLDGSGPEDPEGRGTLGSLTVAENLALGAYVRSDRRKIAAREARVVAYFPWIAERRQQPAGTLSGGEQQMLAIARALMLEPQLLLLDEPSLGLAPKIVRDIFALLRAINREDGVTVLVAEQNATVALEAADSAYVLETGRVATSGPSAELVRNDSIRRSYLGY
jgi:branched-chain amino acid transport system ATP-binding protein